jgi:FkbM family methyltransferase
MRLARRVQRRLPPARPALPLRVGHAATLLVDTRDRLQAELYLTGAWEPRLQQLIVDRLPPGGTFFDVGANVGLASLSVAARLHRSGVRVHAFEPSPANVALFGEQLARNPQLVRSVRLNAVAVGATPGELALRLGAESGHHHLVTDGARGDAQVAVVTLADYAREHGIDTIDVLKMDIEGWELQALRGADELLREHRIRALVCEVEQTHLERAGTSAEALIGHLLSRGYVPVPLERFGQRLRSALTRGLTPAPLAGDVAFLPVEDLADGPGPPRAA